MTIFSLPPVRTEQEDNRIPFVGISKVKQMVSFDR